VTKPFSPRELKARIKAVLRRRSPETAQEPLVGGRAHARSGDAPRRPPTARRSARTNRIPAAAFSAGPAGARPFARAAPRPGLGERRYIEERTVDVHIRRLRQALEPVGQDALIETVRGSGYRLAVPRRH
jgi:two-component system phosphate regulon response regulator PhoB